MEGNPKYYLQNKKLFCLVICIIVEMRKNGGAKQKIFLYAKGLAFPRKIAGKGKPFCFIQLFVKWR